MGSYFYLMAQLPYLIYEQKPPMSSASFKATAAYFLNSADSSLLKHLSLDPAFAQEKTNSDFIDNWREFERALRLNLAKERAIKLRRDTMQLQHPPLFPLEAANAASKAIDESSPLEGEIVLDKARWAAIDSMTGSDNFHRNAVYAYFLKLLLLERREAFNTE
ncbi:MAG: hypothetical protein FWB95_09415, partial [Treponema sp.]|nr:hypothetical protein [Treponema sp.]